MKKIIGTMALLTSLFVFAHAQEDSGKKKYKEIKISLQSNAINVSTDELWQILGPGFEKAGEWSRAVDHSEGIGQAQFKGATCDTRACDINAKGFNKVTERLTYYDSEKQSLTYDIIEGTPGFVISTSSHWQVVSLDQNKAALQMTVTIQSKKFMGSLMGKSFKKSIMRLIPGVFEDLTIYAETGQISEAKKTRMAKLAKN